MTEYLADTGIGKRDKEYDDWDDVPEGVRIDGELPEPDDDHVLTEVYPGRALTGNMEVMWVDLVDDDVKIKSYRGDYGVNTFWRDLEFAVERTVDSVVDYEEWLEEQRDKTNCGDEDDEKESEREDSEKDVGFGSTEQTDLTQFAN